MTTIELALKFILSQPGVTTVLTGPTNFEMLQQQMDWLENRATIPDADLPAIAASAVVSPQVYFSTRRSMMPF
jgi:aryl-alcohol dehydrogenase-like predicted oxidoreductase